jgi:transcriptional regulator with XRE-family HTH domain
MEICERLKEARKKSGMTQEQVAGQIMVSRVTVSHWENGKSLPDIASLIRISDLYHISLDELLKGDPKMEEKVKKDAKDLRNNKRLILTTGTLCLIVGIIYFVSLFVGGVFKDFCVAACPWLLMGIGVAAGIVFSNQ